MTYQIDLQSIGRHFPCSEGATIYEAAREAGVFLASTCGGRMTCGRCRIKVLAGDVSPSSQCERDILGAEDTAAGLRLACITQALSDLTVHIPQHSLAAVQRLAISGEEPPLSLDPVVSNYELTLQEPGLKSPLADWENVCEELEAHYRLKNLRPDLAMLRDLPSVLRGADWVIAATIRNDEVIGVHPSGGELLGIALDIGTTKIAAYLVDLGTGETLAAQGIVNPQFMYGEDVMSRLSHALEGHGNQLRESVVEAINQLITGISGNPEKVVEVTIAGNSTMHHLFLGLPVAQLGRAPYLPAVRHSLEVKGRDLGLKTAPGAYAYFLPNIAGFVGADHVAMLLATGLYKTDKTILGMDIGTNTEIALATAGTITTLSCASGPAFEGAGVSHGMVASRGAIEKVQIVNDTVHFEVIDDTPPTGICGSGILDAISELRKHHLIDQRGRLQDHPLVRQGVGGPEFLLVPATSTGTGKAIVISQHDIGEIQLAKAAIRTGINILLEETRLKEAEIEEVIIAGGFGSYIDVRSAIGIGMLPSLPLERFSQVGNAAGIGAKLALLSKRNRAIAETISKGARYLELTVHPVFRHEFSQALAFP